MIFLGAVIAIAITMLLALVRALLGPSVYDRVLAVNMFGTKTVLLLAVVAFVAGRSDYLDLALAYALINFIGVLAVLEFFRQRKSKQKLSGKAAQAHTEEVVISDTAERAVDAPGERPA